MPWSNQSGGGGNNGPWGPRPGGSGGGGQQPDLEDILRKSQDKLRQAMPGGGGWLLPAVLAVLVAVVIGFFGFFVRVNTDEVGIVLRFGEYVRQLPPGLHVRLPYPIEEVMLPKVTRANRIEIGIRSAQGGGLSVRDVPEESLMLTGDENIVDIDFVVVWKISDAPDYLFNIQNPEGTVKDVSESAMREIVGQSDIEPILTSSRAQTEGKVQQLIQRTLDGYKAGIEITQVQLQKVDPPAQVIDAFRDVQAARADEERLQNEAQAYANRVVPEARGEAERILQNAQGYRDQVIAEAKGEAERFEKVLLEYEKAPDVTRQRIFIDTMKEVFSKTDKIIIDKDGGGGVVPYLPLTELQRKPPQSPASSTSAPSLQTGGQQ